MTRYEHLTREAEDKRLPFGMADRDPFAFHPLLEHLRSVTDLHEQDLQLLVEACGTPRTVSAHVDIVEEGSAPEHLHIILNGWASRCRTLPDGRRQFPGVLVPGDFCDLDALFMGSIQYGVRTLSACTVVTIPHSRMRATLDASPTLRAGFLQLLCLENALLIEAAVGLGRRSTLERMAHFFCELWTRLATIGQALDHCFPLPLTQEELGDTIGSSAVHINRTIQQLKRMGLIELGRDGVVIRDWAALRDLGGFEPDYLGARTAL